MKVVLIWIGKTTEAYCVEAINIYMNRLKHYIPFEIEEIPELKNVKKLSVQQQKEREGVLIEKMLKPGDHIVLLDENGKEYTSEQFATYLGQKQNVLSKRLVFIIGGPYGFSSAIYSKAMEKISLSRMTFSHQMIRILFVEQVYRAMTILNGEPYHHV